MIPYITVYKAVKGWTAAVIGYRNDSTIPTGGRWEPLEVSYFGYSSKEEAITEAKQWAIDEGLEYK